MNKKIKLRKHKIISSHYLDFINKKAAMFPEVKKPLIIAVVSICAILILALLIIFGKGFVGKAYSSIPESTFSPGSAGAENMVEIPLEAGETFDILVGANLGDAKSVAFEFELKYDSNKLEVTSEVDVSSGLLSHWGEDFIRITDSENSVKLEHATIDSEKAITGPVRLAEVTFRVKAGQTLTKEDLASVLGFSDIIVLNLEDQSNIIKGSLTQPSGIAKCPSFTNIDGENWFNSLSQSEKEAICADYTSDCTFDTIKNDITSDNMAELCTMYPSYCEADSKDVIGNDAPRELLIRKLIALINGECYPDVAHPDAVYCEDQQGITKPDADGKITPSQKIRLIVEAGRALAEFFQEVISS